MTQHYFDSLIARHGEPSIQAIIERIERYEGIRSRIGQSLEERWNVLMRDCSVQHRRMAA